MKNICTKNKFVMLIVCLIIIAGVFVYFTKGFNFDMEYAKKDQIVLTNKTGFEISKIEEISKEVLENKEFKVQEVETFKNAVQISAKEITEEEKGKIIEKVNNEYNLEILPENITIKNVSQTRIKDIVRPYILPITISFVLILVYFLICFKKVGVKKVLLKGILFPIFTELTFYSIILTCRIPFGSIATALALGIYVSIFTVLAVNFKKENELIVEENK